MIRVKLPHRILGMVVERAALYQDELLRDWQKAMDSEALDKIAPLP